MAPRATTAGPTTGAGVKVCEQCQKLRELYRQAIGRVARLERLNSSLGADAVLEVVHSLAAKIEEAEQARRAARDALHRHQIERGHS
jgi:hypothetical protein